MTALSAVGIITVNWIFSTWTLMLCLINLMQNRQVLIGQWNTLYTHPQRQRAYAYYPNFVGKIIRALYPQASAYFAHLVMDAATQITNGPTKCEVKRWLHSTNGLTKKVHTLLFWVTGYGQPSRGLPQHKDNAQTKVALFVKMNLAVKANCRWG